MIGTVLRAIRGRYSGGLRGGNGLDILVIFVVNHGLLLYTVITVSCPPVVLFRWKTTATAVVSPLYDMSNVLGC